MKPAPVTTVMSGERWWKWFEMPTDDVVVTHVYWLSVLSFEIYTFILKKESRVFFVKKQT